MKYKCIKTLINNSGEIIFRDGNFYEVDNFDGKWYDVHLTEEPFNNRILYLQVKNSNDDFYLPKYLKRNNILFGR